jgi:hypothetical protein
VNNTEVTKYIAVLPSPQQEIVTRLRDLITTTLPMAEEAYKWKMPTYGNYCYIRSASDHVDLGFYYGALLFDPEAKLEGTGKLLRHIKIHALEDITPAFQTYIIRLLTESVEVSGYIPGAKSVSGEKTVTDEHSHHVGCLHEEPEEDGIYL